MFDKSRVEDNQKIFKVIPHFKDKNLNGVPDPISMPLVYIFHCSLQEPNTLCLYLNLI